MSSSEKLQKALEVTIAAGYQMDTEAFEFLKMLASTKDPTDIMTQVIREIEKAEEKPLFISKSLMERVLLPEKEITQKQIDTSLPPPVESSIIEGKKEYHPYAKDIESSIRIIDDPASRLSSTGTMEDYLNYFRDRFRRMEKLLRQRIDAKSATQIIDALKAPANSKLKVICMITEKREISQKILLTVEDLSANATVLVTQNSSADLLAKAHSLLLDQVVCLGVTKTRSNLLIADEIILPDIPQKQTRRSPVPVYAVLTSDMHVGSVKFNREAFNRFLLWLNGKYGDERLRNIASHVKYVLIAGDIVDGIGVYPNQVRELAVKDVYGQYKQAANYLEQIPDYIEVIMIPGNHDAPRNALPQPPIAGEFLESLQETRIVYSLGNPCWVSIHGTEVLIYHGRSLDDITSTIPGITPETPEKAMKVLLQSRHLAPIYGGKTPISPESKDFMVIERVPDIFHAGHVHILGYANYRGVLMVNSGGWQEQTDYMRRLGVTPTPGKVPVVNLQTFEISVLSFT